MIVGIDSTFFVILVCLFFFFKVMPELIVIVDAEVPQTYSSQDQNR